MQILSLPLALVVMANESLAVDKWNFVWEVDYKHAHILCIKYRLMESVTIMAKMQNIGDKYDRLYICNL